MATDKQTREAVYNSFSEKTQGIFAYRKNDIFDNSKAFSLILSMLAIEKAGAPKKDSSRVTVLNQGEEKLEFLHGVEFTFDPKTGKPVFKEA